MRILYWILQWTWGLLQNLAGVIILIWNINRKHFMYKGAIVTIWRVKGLSASVGMFLFLSAECPEDLPGKLGENGDFQRILVHEYGHSIQSVILGVLYLPVITLPSAVWALTPWLKRMRKERRISYYSFYTERWADFLGEKTTGRESAGRCCNF